MSSERTFYQVRVAEVVAETDQACSLVLDIPAGLAGAFAYLPGQFLTVRIPHNGEGSVARCYSLSSSPHTGDRHTITVKRVDDAPSPFAVQLTRLPLSPSSIVPARPSQGPVSGCGTAVRPPDSGGAQLPSSTGARGAGAASGPTAAGAC